MGSHSTYLSQSKMRGQELLWKTRLGWGRIHARIASRETNRLLAPHSRAGDPPSWLSNRFRTDTPRSLRTCTSGMPPGRSTLFEGVRGHRALSPGEPRRRIGHAEILIGTSRIMLADEFPEMNVKGPSRSRELPWFSDLCRGCRCPVRPHHRRRDHGAPAVERSVLRRPL